MVDPVWIPQGPGFFARLIAEDHGVGLTSDNPSFGAALAQTTVAGLPVVMACWRLSEGVVASAAALLHAGALSVTVFCDPVTVRDDAAQVTALKAAGGRMVLTDSHVKGFAVGDRLVLSSSNGDGRQEWNWWASCRKSDAVAWFTDAIHAHLGVAVLLGGPQVVAARTVASMDLLEGFVARGPLWLANWNCCKAITRRLNARGPGVHVLLDAAVDRINPEASTFRRKELRAICRIQSGVHAKVATDGRRAVFTSANWQTKNLRREAYWAVESEAIAHEVRRFVESGVSVAGVAPAVLTPPKERRPLASLVESAGRWSGALDFDEIGQGLLRLAHG